MMFFAPRHFTQRRVISWMNLRACLCLVGLWGWAGSVLAIPPQQIQQMIHRHWEEAVVASELNVTSLAQGEDGYLWMGTTEGLVRFDGVRFSYFRRIEVPGLIHDNFRTLLMARDQTLYGGTVEGGLVQMRKKEFRSFLKTDGLLDQHVTALAEMEDGTIAIGTYNHGVFLLRNQTVSHASIEQLQNVSVNCLFYADQALWIGELEKGIVGHWDGKHYTRFTLPSGSKVGAVQSIVKGPDGFLYIATSKQGLFKMKPKVGEEVRRIPGPSTGLGGSGAMAFDSAGALWVALETGGVARLADGIWSTTMLSLGLSPRAAGALLSDREGNMWVGTRSGVDCFYPGAVTTYGKPEGIGSDDVTCVTEDNLGQIWVGTSDHGLSVISSNGISIIDTGIEHRSIQCLAPAKDGGVWFGTENGLGLYKNGDIKFFGVADGLKGSPIWTVYEDENRDVWVGMRHGDGGGLLRLRSGSGETRVIQNESLGVRAMVSDGQGGLWLGTQTNGLISFRDGKVLGFWSKGEGLSDDSVRGLYVDSMNVLWVGTRDRGVNRFYNGKIDRYRREHGFEADLVSGIIGDEDQNLWMATPRGILRTTSEALDRMILGNPQPADFSLYGPLDGMRWRECQRLYSPTAQRDREGRLWFATKLGLSMIDPKVLKQERGNPKVLLESVSLNGAEQIVRDDLVFDQGGGHVNFSFAATALRSPSKVRFRCKLEGIDPDWVLLPFSKREVSYRNVKPGRYDFLVQAAFGIEEFSGSPSVVTVTLPPFFYQTNSFYGGIVVSLLAGLFLIHWIRLQVVAQRAVVLEGVVENRTSELRKEIKQRKKFEEKLRELPTRLLQAEEGERRRVASELHDSVSQLLAMIRFRLHHIETIVGNQHPVQRAMVKTKRLLENTVQEVRRISKNLRPSELDDFGLKVALDHVCEDFRTRSSMELVLDYQGLPVALPSRLDQAIYRIVQESLTNIERHSRAKTVRVELVADREYIVVTIRDDGVGFGTNHPLGGKKSGIGLLNIQNRTIASGGVYTIKAASGEGVEIRVKFPLEPLVSHETN